MTESTELMPTPDQQPVSEVGPLARETAWALRLGSGAGSGRHRESCHDSDRNFRSGAAVVPRVPKAGSLVVSKRTKPRPRSCVWWCRPRW